MHSARFLLPILAPTLALTACGATGTENATDDTASAPPAASADCVQDYDPQADADTDYFPEKLELDHAENLTIDYENHYQVVTVEEPAPDADPERYVLLRCGLPEPELTDELAEAPVVEVPVDSVFSRSTTHLPLFQLLDRTETVTGVADGSTVSTTEYRERLDDGDIVEFAVDQTLDQELVISHDPDLVMTAGVQDPDDQGVRDAGIPVIANAEWLEPTPLGRAEWIKLAAALTGTERQARAEFADIEADYRDIAEQVADAESVQVLTGQMRDGVWTVPAGDSYAGRLLADAGADYAWSDTTGGASVELDVEEVLAQAQDTTPWIAGADWGSLDDVTADDGRYAEFTAVTTGEVWTNNNKIGPTGGNLYWEEGVSRPDLVLADLVRIVHPDLLEEHELVYYRQLDEA
ncbi:ABC transporter substrate-binding protein [Lipingzhangella sp. LS1_29]|uniref:ABC transporter substrate-binding protein n=1 Tax=Lipingzhangella rawalii TaxID=2055835 RepID=A0ABU2H4U4_9ACTN|nr:ABC transporter substrate-binding protein [Lipingzhangella rawalii]MDS1270318.1 ABC transporter substrate-binding protein [Lipingzhangella rawalii]